jgi:RNA polymerase sigma-70 factor (ECF subfamily)
MPEPSCNEVTQLLRKWSCGDASALDKLIPLVYSELHRTARRYMSFERNSHTMQPTALVHEVYVRLVGAQSASWQDRAHFFAVCARMMRRILTDSARARRSQKRGGDLGQVSFTESLPGLGKPGMDLVALDDALNGLARLDERKSQVVELRFFGGLSVEETAEVLKTSKETVKRDWSVAKLWLLREMGGEAAGGT